MTPAQFVALCESADQIFANQCNVTHQLVAGDTVILKEDGYLATIKLRPEALAEAVVDDYGCIAVRDTSHRMIFIDFYKRMEVPNDYR